tara:strand:+ start:832 stop:1593 length:762 start_codon:yes stop_codon:yes gene_type:complete
LENFKTETFNKSFLRTFLKSLPFFNKLLKNLNIQYERDKFVVSELSQLKQNSLLLDAGCGNQRYRAACSHLKYRSQDFGEYTSDDVETLGTDSMGFDGGYKYGKLDYKGDIWDVDEKDQTFNAILCTEVLEHIPYPNETIAEFSRLLKQGGKLILTAPNACLRHMNPYFFYTGFSDVWYKKILEKNNFQVNKISPVGDYYRYMAVETARTMALSSFFVKIIIFPSFLYFYLKKRTKLSTNTLCIGYHVIATKK